jgi:predicted DNA binding protein
MVQIENFDEPYHISIEVINNKCKSLKIIKELGFTDCKLLDVRSIEDGFIRHLIGFSSKERKKVEKKISTDIHVQGNNFWFNSSGCALCNTIIEYDSFLIKARKIKGNTILYSFVTPSHSNFQNILLELEKKGFSPKVAEVTKFTPKNVLTDRQEKIFWIAVKMGFFDFPRKINTKELSNKLGIAQPTLSEILRRGTKRLVNYYFQ